MKTLNFVIKVTLLPNKDIGIDLTKSKIRNYIENMKKSLRSNDVDWGSIS